MCVCVCVCTPTRLSAFFIFSIAFLLFFNCYYFNLSLYFCQFQFFHIQDKERAVRKVANLLRLGGRFVLSIDKAHGDILELSSRKVRLYPDTPTQMQAYLQNAGLTVLEKTETERAHIFVSEKQRDL